MTDFRFTSRKIAILSVAVLTLFAAPGLSAWVYSEFSFDAETRMAMMAKAGLFNPYLEVKGSFHSSDPAFLYHSVTAGAYVRAAPWLKIGAFYRFQGNARHLEDWVVALPDNHSWTGSSGRSEHILMGDATPRFLLPGINWMPEGDWVGAVKIRYAYNLRNSEQTLLLRPGLTWVKMQDREPVLNLSLQYPLYFALNFGDAPLYGHGPYFTALWHLKDWMKLEGRLQYQHKIYAKTEWGGPWILHSHHILIGVGLLFTPDFGG